MIRTKRVIGRSQVKKYPRKSSTSMHQLPWIPDRWYEQMQPDNITYNVNLNEHFEIGHRAFHIIRFGFHWFRVKYGISSLLQTLWGILYIQALILLCYTMLHQLKCFSWPWLHLCMCETIFNFSVIHGIWSRRDAPGNILVFAGGAGYYDFEYIGPTDLYWEFYYAFCFSVIIAFFCYFYFYKKFSLPVIFSIEKFVLPTARSMTTMKMHNS